VVKSVLVDRHSPFEVNQLGMGGTRFPLSIRRAHHESLWTVQGTALRVIDFVDLALDLLGPVSVVSNVGQTAFVDDTGREFDVWTTSRIAAEQGVAAQVHDMSWATPTPSLGHGDVLVLESSDLRRFFTGWSLYDVDLVDAAGHPDREECEEIVLATNSRIHSDPPLLGTLDRPSVYFSGHDDCYFYAESRDEQLSWRITNRLVALLAGTILLEREAEGEVVVCEPDEDFARQLFNRSDAWVGTGYLADSEQVIVELTAGEWRPPQFIPHQPTLLARLATTTGTWSVEERTQI
jgi:hypothetical protein